MFQEFDREKNSVNVGKGRLEMMQVFFNRPRSIEKKEWRTYRHVYIDIQYASQYLIIYSLRQEPKLF